MIPSRSFRSSMRSFRSSRPRTLGALTLLLLLAACAKKTEVRAKPPVPVVVVKARLADVPYNIDANGVVVPMRAASVASQVEGIIRKVSFSEGRDVVAGQVLFEIDPRPYRAAYMQAQANLARDKANADNSRRESERYAALSAQDYVTKEQADQQRANAAATAASVMADEAVMATAKFNLDNTTIRAPISGRTGALLVKEGNLVHASGNASLVVINQVSPILVRFSIPATQLPLLQKYGAAGGLDVTATPNSGADQRTDSASSTIGLSMGGGDAAAPTRGGSGSPERAGGMSSSGGRGSRGPRGGGSDAGGGGGGGAGKTARPTSRLTALSEPEHGALSFIDNAVDTTTGTVLLKASFTNAEKRLWTGEFVATQLKLFVESNALVVPASAVVTGQQGPYVYVVTDSGTAQQRSVTVERTAGALTIIASGLRNGEQVVTDGQSRLTPNSRVIVTTPSGGGGRGGAGGAGGGRRSGGRGGTSGGQAGGAAAGSASPRDGKASPASPPQ